MQSPGDAACEVCGDDGGVATKYCVNCEQKLCEVCSRPHLKWKGGAHQVVSLDEDVDAQTTSCGSVCEKHTDRLVDIYCYDCQTNICTACYAVSHKEHQCHYIKDVFESVKHQVDIDLKLMRGHANVVRQLSQKFAASRQSTFDLMMKTASLVKQKGEEVKSLVDSQVGEILDKISNAKATAENEYSSVQNRMKCDLMNLESFVNFAEELSTKGTPSEVTQASGELHDRAVQLERMMSTAEYKYNEVDVTFTPVVANSDKPLGSQDRNLVGKIAFIKKTVGGGVTSNSRNSRQQRQHQQTASRQPSRPTKQTNSVDQPESSYQKLFAVTEKYHLRVVDMPRGGDSALHAIVHQLNQGASTHQYDVTTLRRQAVNYLGKHQSMIGTDIGDVSKYLMRLAKPDTPCDEVFLEAVAHVIMTEIRVIHDDDTMHVVEIQESSRRPPIIIGLYDGIHYVSLTTATAPAVSQSGRSTAAS